MILSKATIFEQTRIVLSLLHRLTLALIVLLALCVTACSTSRKGTEASRSVLTTDYTNLTDKHDSVTVIIRDTLREVTTITIRENEQGDTLRVSTVTDRVPDIRKMDLCTDMCGGGAGDCD